MKSKSHAKVVVEELGPVLLMTLNRPEVLNAVEGS
jgi:enoyl-CoA hydratase/carnithine racemase